MALLTVSDIEVYLGRQLAADEYERAEMLLDMAIGEIEAYLGRPVGPNQFTEEIEVDEGGRIYLWNTPVISVESVTIDGEEIDSDYWRATKWGVQYLNNYGTFSTSSFNSSGLYDLATVEYTAGIESRQINSLLLFGVTNRMANFDAMQATPTTAPVSPCDPFEGEPVESTATGGSISVAGNVKRIKVEDYEVEYESAATTASKSYSTGSSPLLIFPSELDFMTIKQHKRVRTA